MILTAFDKLTDIAARAAAYDQLSDADKRREAARWRTGGEASRCLGCGGPIGCGCAHARYMADEWERTHPAGRR